MTSKRLSYAVAPSGSLPVTQAASQRSWEMESLPQLHQENMAMRIYRELRARIMTGQFDPGETLTLRTISSSMGVSQTPVREALLQLSSEAILSFNPRRSITVPRLSRRELEELRLIRSSLEGMAAWHAAQDPSPELISELRRINDEMVLFKQERNIAGLLEQNLHFHFTLYHASGLPTLLAIIEGLWARTGPYIRFLYRRPFSLPPSGHPHDAIIAGLERKDATKVEAALRLDIDYHWAILMRNAIDERALRDE